MPLQETIHTISDTLPGGQRRRESRIAVQQGHDVAKAARKDAIATELVRRPVRARVKLAGPIILIGGGLIALHQSGGDRAVGDAAGEFTGDMVRGGINATGGALNITKGAVSGGKEAVQEETGGNGIDFRSPIVISDTEPSGQEDGLDLGSPETTVPNVAPATTTPAAGQTYSPLIPGFDAAPGEGLYSAVNKCYGFESGAVPNSKKDQLGAAIVALSPALADGFHVGDRVNCL